MPVTSSAIGGTIEAGALPGTNKYRTTAPSRSVTIRLTTKFLSWLIRVSDSTFGPIMTKFGDPKGSMQLSLKGSAVTV